MLQDASYEETQMALGRGQGNGDEYLAVRFYMDASLNPQKTEEEGRPIYDDVPWIEIMQPGNKNSIIVRPATEMDKQRFPSHWRMWKDRISDAEIITGTPLSEWPGITRGQVAELSFFNIKTVEQLANMADSNTRNMMGLVSLKEKAKTFLEVAKETATAEALTAANKRIDQLMRQMQDMVAAKSAPVAPEEKIVELVMSGNTLLQELQQDTAFTIAEESVPCGTIDPVEEVLAHIAEGNPNPPPKKKRHRRTKAEIEAAKG